MNFVLIFCMMVFVRLLSEPLLKEKKDLIIWRLFMAILETERLILRPLTVGSVFALTEWSFTAIGTNLRVLHSVSMWCLDKMILTSLKFMGQP